MYDDILFPVSFYLLDESDMREHAEAVATEFDARLHLLSVTLQDEGKRDVEQHKEAFLGLADGLETAGVEVTTEFRDEPIDYDTVAEVIVDESDGFDLVVMGHTRISRERSETGWTTADRVINASSVPVLVIPLSAPRFRDVY